MSYCRWSSDDYQCDVYVWADVDGGWRTWVADRRWIFNELPEPVELPRNFTDEQFFAWQRRNQEVTRMRGNPEHGHWRDLPETESGHSYRHDTPGECADNLERLRQAGLNVPQYAIDALREEAGT
jgi:hypothetical protein